MSVYWALGDLMTGLQIMSVIAVGAAFAANGEISAGTLLAFISYNSSLTWPIRSLGRTLSEMSKSGVSIDRVAYILRGGGGKRCCRRPKRPRWTRTSGLTTSPSPTRG